MLMSALGNEFLWAFVGCAVLASLFFYKAAFQGQVLFGESSDQAAGSSELYREVYSTSIPAARFGWEAFRRDSVPFWNPYTLTGVPFMAQSVHGVFEVSKLLLYRFTDSFASFWNLLIWMRFVLAGFFMYGFIRRIGLSRGAAAFGTVAWMFSAAMVAHAGESAQATWIYLPLILWCLEGIVRSESHRYPVALALATAATIYAGHLSTIAQLCFFVVWYLGARFISLVRDRYVIREIFGKYRVMFKYSCLGLLLAAPQILPTIELAIQSSAISRTVSQTMETFSSSVQSGAGWRGFWELLLLVSPTSALEQKNHVWAFAGSTFASAGLYIGLGSVVFILLALLLGRKRRFMWFSLLSGCLFFVLSAHLPGMERVTAVPLINLLHPERMRYLAVWSFALVASFGFEAVFRHFRRWTYASLLVVGLLWVDLFLAHSPYIPAAPQAAGSQVPATIQSIQRDNPERQRIISLSDFLPPGQATLYRTSDIRGPGAWIPERVSAFLTPWLKYENGVWVADRIQDIWYDLAAVRFIIADFPSDFTVCGGGDLTLGNDTARGYSLLSSAPYAIIQNDNALKRAFIVDRVQRYGTSNGVIERMKSPLFHGAFEALVEERGDAPFLETLEQRAPVATTSPDVAMVSYLPDQVELTVRADQNAFLVLTDTWYPGWSATIDGKRTVIYPTDAAFRGIYVPAGLHQIVFTYRSGLFIWGLGFAGFAGVWLLWLSIPSFRRYAREGMMHVRGVMYDLKRR
ncbi:hypothetical protein AUK40_02435 [Candidatus Wirthbacteria bacterium CG2_30_54_11]|uniref:Membrane protein 6-pyruvoyl-tetrahydropterin synthase-related domain-containing protein n=1 Tax=Candidatus Wirthbacteria bacterium CG2_30_54_11 TaxID=1817892 RepID=A0A1J5J2W0_9BACT|nr:MAG: hypothetical protein AUK40_02435 [Candidatus Wirthbacteria bacterium CG2_30_54_11]